jgi:CRISP-associated protein Cas1
MLRRIVEITGEGKRLSLDRGFLSISSAEGLLGSVPLDDIEAVIAASPALSYSGQVIDALAKRGTPLVICGDRFTPSVWMLPVNGHHAQGTRIEAQAEASQATRKKLWSDIVAAKVEAQAQALAAAGRTFSPLRRLKAEIRSGDPGNIEALAAQYYFPTLFGAGFRRDRELEGANALLNYGYTILRAAAARAIVASGLHPSLGVFHKSRGDAFRLADDVMEPFRPTVDLEVLELLELGKLELDTDVKRRLVRVLHLDFQTVEGRTPLSTCLARMTSSLAQIYLKERKELILPSPLLPLPDDGPSDREEGVS